MNSSLLKAFLFLGFFAPLSLKAVEKGNLSSINTGSSPYDELTDAPEVARVRIPLKMTFFEQVVIKGQDGIRRMESKALTPNRFNFKATINRTNHFYVNGWHVESVPMKWDRDTKKWDVDVKFYKRYGEDQELEEFVGTMPISGTLVGKDMLFTLDAQGSSKFQNKLGNPLLLVEINNPRYENKGEVARRDTQKSRTAQ